MQQLFRHKDLNECQVQPRLCAPNGNCVNQNGSYDCECKPGWTGDNCQKGKDNTLFLIQWKKTFLLLFHIRFRWHMVPSEWFSVQKVKLLRYQLFKAKFEHYELLCTENMTLSIYTCIHLFNIFLYILHIQHQNVLHYMFFDPNPTLLFLKYKLISYIKFYYLIMQCYLFLWCLIFIVLY